MKIASEKDMLAFGKNFAKKCKSSQDLATVIELVGDVGTGKTTFTRGLASGLGITEPVTSPSFTISKSYALPNGGKLIHYDFYRLPDPGIMLDDLSDNLQNPQNIIIIEWGESTTDFLPANRAIIHINYSNDGTREVAL